MGIPTGRRDNTELSAADVAAAGLTGCLSALIALRRMVAGGLAGVPGDLEDGRLNAFLLEHSWGWLARAAGHERLWGLPSFFPAGGNALASSDAMVSFGFLYWPWRALGFAPDTSYQAWVLAVMVVNGLACHLFLRYALGASTLAAALGAWLAACSASRLHQISHSQLLPLFFVVAALAGAVGWARCGAPGRRRLAAGGVAAAVVLQLYGGFYLGLFAGVAIAAVAVVALSQAEQRRSLLQRLRSDWAWLLVIAGVAALALVPWFIHYSAVYDLMSTGRWEKVASMLPRPRSWLFMPPSAWAYGWTRHASFFRGLPWDFEHAVGIGFFTTAITLCAAASSRREPVVRLTAGATALLIVVTTAMPGGFSIWRWVVELVPPLAAARAVARIGLLLPLAAAVILVSAADRASTPRARALLLLGLALAGAEQLGGLRLQDKATQRHWVAEIVRRVDPAARAFVVTRQRRSPGATVVHLDAMWAANASGVPTVNGHSGNLPPKWEAVSKARISNAVQRAEFQSSLHTWLQSRGVATELVQVIEMPPSYRRRPPRARPRQVTGRVRLE